jgi:hypothetical protein
MRPLREAAYELERDRDLQIKLLFTRELILRPDCLSTATPSFDPTVDESRPHVAAAPTRGLFVDYHQIRTM